MGSTLKKISFSYGYALGHNAITLTNTNKYTYSCKSMKRESPGGL